mgnify:CR=1 FL=1
MIPKSVKELEELIINSIEESFNLEYKSAESLKDTNRRNSEIAKDVSAMANSAGGILIYGIKEFDYKDKKHLPEKLSPINRKDFSREQLDQIITANISPKIEGLRIHPISVNVKDDVVYVVEIPQSNTAHQNTKDHKYYKRHNFMSEPMLDYEIRDVMNRNKNPNIRLSFEIFKETFVWKERLGTLFRTSYNLSEKHEYRTEVTLKIVPINEGEIYAKYIQYFVHIPEDILDLEKHSQLKKLETGTVEYCGDNTHRFRVSNNEFSPPQFDPILPGTKGIQKELHLVQDPKLDSRELLWQVHADNAAVKSDKIKLCDVKFVEIDPWNN